MFDLKTHIRDRKSGRITSVNPYCAHVSRDHGMIFERPPGSKEFFFPNGQKIPADKVPSFVTNTKPRKTPQSMEAALRESVKADVRGELKEEVRAEVMAELRAEMEADVATANGDVLPIPTKPEPVSEPEQEPVIPAAAQAVDTQSDDLFNEGDDGREETDSDKI